LSWAPGFLGSPQPANDTHPELVADSRVPDTRQHHHERPRSSATRLSRRLSSHISSHLGLLDAGPSPPDAEPRSGRSRARLTRARTSLSSMAGLLQRRPSMAARDVYTDTDDAPAFVTSGMPGRSAQRPTAS